jgi:hypothetical protein
MRAIEGIIDRRADRGAGRLYVSYVGSGFSRTFTGPPEGGHYVHVKSALG